MMKYAPFFIILILILIAIPLYSDAINTSQTLEAERLQRQAERLENQVAIDNLAGELHQTQNDLVKANAELKTTQTELKSKADLAANLQEKLTHTQQELDTTSAALKNTEAERTAYMDRYLAAAAEAETFKKTFICQNVTPPVFDYTSNQAISENLKNVVSSLQTPIKKGEWQVMWDNSNITLHNIFGNYKWVFIVTFKDASLGLKSSVYWVDRSCFLDWTF